MLFGEGLDYGLTLSTIMPVCGFSGRTLAQNEATEHQKTKQTMLLLKG
jgi:hypothetical protein